VQSPGRTREDSKSILVESRRISRTGAITDGLARVLHCPPSGASPYPPAPRKLGDPLKGTRPLERFSLGWRTEKGDRHPASPRLTEGFGGIQAGSQSPSSFAVCHATANRSDPEMPESDFPILRENVRPLLPPEVS
jgi:hypothetical protein